MIFSAAGVENVQTSRSFQASTSSANQAGLASDQSGMASKTAAVKASCYDSDVNNGASAIYVPGYIKVVDPEGTRTIIDACSDNNQNIIERMCNGVTATYKKYPCTYGCAIDNSTGYALCNKQPPVKTYTETDTCVFSGATTTQKCYGTTNTNSYFSCGGVGSCTVTVSGPLRQSVSWSSSCPNNNTAYTTIDGQNEKAFFNCTQPAVACKDSDGGMNYYVAGTASDAYKSYSDYCSSATVLNEAFCDPVYGANIASGYNCTYGCSNGACINKSSPPPTLQLYVNGQVNPGPVNYNTTFTVNWISSESSCYEWGSPIPIVGDGLWTSEKNLPTTGSRKLLASGAKGEYLPIISVGIQCSPSGMTKQINVTVNPPVVPDVCKLYNGYCVDYLGPHYDYCDNYNNGVYAEKYNICQNTWSINDQMYRNVCAVAETNCNAKGYASCLNGNCTKPLPPSTCGNGNIEASEQCDGSLLGYTGTTQGYMLVGDTWTPQVGKNYYTIKLLGVASPSSLILNINGDSRTAQLGNNVTIGGLRVNVMNIYYTAYGTSSAMIQLSKAMDCAEYSRLYNTGGLNGYFSGGSLGCKYNCTYDPSGCY